MEQSETLNDGSQLYLDGVAVYNRVLKPEELKALSFNTSNFNPTSGANAPKSKFISLTQ